MTDEKDKEALRQRVAKQIEEAFADTPYPRDNNIGSTDRDDDRDIELALRGQHWREITLEAIFEYRGHLPFLTPNALQFYLPAFMLATLNHYSEVDTLSSNLIFMLAPPGEENDEFSAYFLARASRFNRAEQAAILAFLETYFPLYPEYFAYGEWESPYKALLEDAIMFWKNKLAAASDAG